MKNNVPPGHSANSSSAPAAKDFARPLIPNLGPPTSPISPTSPNGSSNPELSSRCSLARMPSILPPLPGSRAGRRNSRFFANDCNLDESRKFSIVPSASSPGIAAGSDTLRLLHHVLRSALAANKIVLPAGNSDVEELYYGNVNVQNLITHLEAGLPSSPENIANIFSHSGPADPPLGFLYCTNDRGTAETLATSLDQEHGEMLLSVLNFPENEIFVSAFELFAFVAHVLPDGTLSVLAESLRPAFQISVRKSKRVESAIRDATAPLSTNSRKELTTSTFRYLLPYCARQNLLHNLSTGLVALLAESKGRSNPSNASPNSERSLAQSSMPPFNLLLYVLYEKLVSACLVLPLENSAAEKKGWKSAFNQEPLELLRTHILSACSLPESIHCLAAAVAFLREYSRTGEASPALQYAAQAIIDAKTVSDFSVIQDTMFIPALCIRVKWTLLDLFLWEDARAKSDLPLMVSVFVKLAPTTSDDPVPMISLLHEAVLRYLSTLDFPNTTITTIEAAHAASARLHAIAKRSVEFWWPLMSEHILPADWWAAVITPVIQTLITHVVAPIDIPSISAVLILWLSELSEFETYLNTSRLALMPSIQVVEFGLAKRFEKVVHEWVNRQQSFLQNTIRTAYKNDQFINSVHSHVFYSESAVQVMQCANSAISMLFKIPLGQLIEQYVMVLMYQLHEALCLYISMCAFRGDQQSLLPTRLEVICGLESHVSSQNDDAASGGQRSITGITLKSIALRLNNVAFIATQGAESFETLRQNCEKRNIAHLAWDCTASRIIYLAGSTARELCEIAARVFLYSPGTQIRADLEATYRATGNSGDTGVTASGLNRLLRVLDIRPTVGEMFGDPVLHKEVLHAYAEELVDFLQDLLFYPHDDRVYTEWTYTKIFEVDIFELRKLLSAGSGYPSGGYELRISRISHIASVLMQLPSKVLAEAYEKAVKAEGRRGVIDPDQAMTATNIRRVLMKRSDSESKWFKKKFNVAWKSGRGMAAFQSRSQLSRNP